MPCFPLLCVPYLDDIVVVVHVAVHDLVEIGVEVLVLTFAECMANLLRVSKN